MANLLAAVPNDKQVSFYKDASGNMQSQTVEFSTVTQNTGYAFQFVDGSVIYTVPPIASYLAIPWVVSFVTGSAGNRLMRVNITGFNDNTYFDGSAIVKYTKAYPMPNSISTLMVDSSDTDRNDVEVFIREENVGMSSLVIEVSIDDLYKDISPSNPLYIEFTIS